MYNRQHYIEEGATHCRIGRVLMFANCKRSWQRQAFVDGYNGQKTYMEGYAIHLGISYDEIMKYATLRLHPTSRPEVPEEVLSFLDSVLKPV